MFALPLPPVVLVLQPPQSGTHSHLAFATLPLPIPFVAFLKLTAYSRPSAPHSDSPKCLRFGHWLTLCTLNIHLLTYLLTYLLTDGLGYLFHDVVTVIRIVWNVDTDTPSVDRYYFVRLYQNSRVIRIVRIHVEHLARLKQL